jgi:hypothetical protein
LPPRKFIAKLQWRCHFRIKAPISGPFKML